MALSVCLLLDARSDRTVRALWDRLEQAGVGTLLSHTHGRHRPHLSLASLLEWDPAATVPALEAVSVRGPLPVRFEGLGMFRRSRCWLAPAGSTPLLVRQRQVVERLRETPGVLHRHYEPDSWTPHLTLAPRLHLAELPTVARLAFEVLPIEASLDRLALIDTRTGEMVWVRG